MFRAALLFLAFCVAVVGLIAFALEWLGAVRSYPWWLLALLLAWFLVTLASMGRART